MNFYNINDENRINYNPYISKEVSLAFVSGSEPLEMLYGSWISEDVSLFSHNRMWTVEVITCVPNISSDSLLVGHLQIFDHYKKPKIFYVLLKIVGLLWGSYIYLGLFWFYIVHADLKISFD